jgi:hypothetical protein
MTLDPDRPFDLFWRNPHNYYVQLIQNGEVNIAWDRGVLSKMSINAQMFSKLKFSHLQKGWRIYDISSWDAIEYDQDCKMGVPRAVYPTHDMTNEPWSALQRYVDEPWGEDNDLINDPELDIKERPVRGQPHRVFITNIPNTGTYEGKSSIGALERLQKQNPQVELYLHHLYTYNVLFGNNFKAGDIDPRMHASKGKFMLSNGKYFDTRTADRDEVNPLIRHMGWEFDDLDDAANRCLFNIQTARFASLHWDRSMRPPEKKPANFRPDITSSDNDTLPPSVKKKLQEWADSKKATA